MTDISKLIGKPIDQLTPKELAELQSNLANLTQGLATREQEIKAASTDKAFAAIAKVAKAQMEGLAWQKLPPLTLVGQDDGNYRVDYVATKAKGKGKAKGNGDNGRTVLGLNGGKITVNKLGEMLGGIANIKLADGREFDNVRSAVIDGLGYNANDKSHSFSYRLTDEHPETILVLTNGQEISIKDAIAKMKSARATVASTDTPEPAPETIEA